MLHASASGSGKRLLDLDNRCVGIAYPWNGSDALKKGCIIACIHSHLTCFGKRRMMLHALAIGGTTFEY